LLQIYQSSFLNPIHNARGLRWCWIVVVANLSKFLFESYSQQQISLIFLTLCCCKFIKVPFWILFTTFLRLLIGLFWLLQIYQSSFLNPIHNISQMVLNHLMVVANLSKFLFESYSQHIFLGVLFLSCCCKFIKVPFWILFTTQRRRRISLTRCCKFIKVPFWILFTTIKQIWRHHFLLLQIYQSSFLNPIHNYLIKIKIENTVVANLSKFLFESYSQPVSRWI